MGTPKRLYGATEKSKVVTPVPGAMVGATGTMTWGVNEAWLLRFTIVTFTVKLPGAAYACETMAPAGVTGVLSPKSHVNEWFAHEKLYPGWKSLAVKLIVSD